MEYCNYPLFLLCSIVKIYFNLKPIAVAFHWNTRNKERIKLVLRVQKLNNTELIEREKRDLSEWHQSMNLIGLVTITCIGTTWRGSGLRKRYWMYKSERVSGMDKIRRRKLVECEEKEKRRNEGRNEKSQRGNSTEERERQRKEAKKKRIKENH